MDRRRGIRSNIVPGRRPITRIAALHEAGMDENLSYMNEKTVLDESSQMNDTTDVEEREWKKKGLSENQIQRLFEARKQKQLKNAQERLHKEKYGAKGFDEMLRLPQYASGRESDEEEEYQDENKTITEIQVFAIPALPKHLSEKSIMGSPVAGSKGSGKAGLSCSTPKSASDVSMRSLRSLDISHVISTDQLDVTRATTHTKNVMLPIVESREESSLQKTHTIKKDASSELQRTYTVAKDAEVVNTDTESASKNKDDSSLQKTFTVAGNPESEETTSSLQKTFTVEAAEGKERESSLQNTFVRSKDWDNSFASTKENHKSENSKKIESTDKEQVVVSPKGAKQPMPNASIHVEVEPLIVESSIQGGERRKFNKTGAREKRGANNSMMASMIEDVPSPGANYFKNPRKKLRSTAKSPSKVKAISRLSTESEKEKTIDMLSIAEEASIDAESVSSSYVDPVSNNGTRVSPVPEVEEPMEVVTTTPKSSLRGTSYPIRGSLMEKARGGLVCSSPTAPNLNNESLLGTPKLNYQKPTVSSILKSKGAPDCNDILGATRREHRTPANNAISIPSRQSPVHNSPSNLKDDHEPSGLRKTPEKDISEVPEVRNRTSEIFHQPPNDIDLSMGAMTIQSADSNQRVNYDYDMDYGDDFEPYQDSDIREEHESESGGPSRPGKIRHRVGLLSDSIATVNTPGVDRRPTRHVSRNETIPEDSWSEDELEEAGRRRNGGRRDRNVGLPLKPRELIKPGNTSDGVRRSQRTRVKPVRSWLGEQAVYINSPSGGKRLTGVTDVIVKDKRLCRFKTADLRVATEREQKAKARKKEMAARKREQLARDHRKGRRLNESQEDILTDDEMA